MKLGLLLVLTEALSDCTVVYGYGGEESLQAWHACSLVTIPTIIFTNGLQRLVCWCALEIGSSDLVEKRYLIFVLARDVFELELYLHLQPSDVLLHRLIERRYLLLLGFVHAQLLLGGSLWVEDEALGHILEVERLPEPVELALYLFVVELPPQDTSLQT